MDPETRKGVAVVFLFGAAFLLLLSYFDLAGAFGNALNDGVSYVFGWDKLFVPFLLMAWAYHVLAPDRLPLRFTNVLGFLLFFLSLNPLVHAVTFPGVAVVSDAALMQAGGKLGETVGSGVINMLGLAGSIVVLIAVLVISLLLIFNATLRQVLFVIDLVWKGIAMFFKGALHPINAWNTERAKEKASATLKPM